MAYATKAIVFSGSAAEGSLQIKSAKFYVDTAANGGTNEKYIGLTDQKMSASILDEKKEYKQDGVMRVEQCVPVTVAESGGHPRRVDNVGKQDRGEYAIVLDIGLMAGHELDDLAE